MAPASATARVRFAPVEGAAQIFTEHPAVSAQQPILIRQAVVSVEDNFQIR